MILADVSWGWEESEMEKQVEHELSHQTDDWSSNTRERTIVELNLFLINNCLEV